MLLWSEPVDLRQRYRVFVFVRGRWSMVFAAKDFGRALVQAARWQKMLKCQIAIAFPGESSPK